MSGARDNLQAAERERVSRRMTNPNPMGAPHMPDETPKPEPAADAGQRERAEGHVDMKDTDNSSDLNQVIISAEAEVAAALSGSELMRQYVASALSAYRTRRTTFLKEAIDKAIQDATEAAVRKLLAEEAPQIAAEVAKELRKNVKLGEAAQSPYGVRVELNYPRQS